MVLWLRSDSQKEGVNKSVTSPLILAGATTGLVRLGLPPPCFYISIYKLQTTLLSPIITKHKWTLGFLDAVAPSSQPSQPSQPSQADCFTLPTGSFLFVSHNFVTSFYRTLQHLMTTSKTSNKGLALFFATEDIIHIYILSIIKKV